MTLKARMFNYCAVLILFLLNLSHFIHYVCSHEYLIACLSKLGS